ncbi:phosphatase PAP2 family protein [Nocardia gipuzkoensis]|uniref:phosphatase PAP2 family protein n=1 Tax=Nocardia gipuzkoensis TaxID=2749991 RepID=UPI001E523329|nr:phosphatase PAP2 family protein [Nocardia gipuzkoensis]UGT67801.1 phosphatase PAP2 family protein [Nocardia gipuzkoensis]
MTPSFRIGRRRRSGRPPIGFSALERGAARSPGGPARRGADCGLAIAGVAATAAFAWACGSGVVDRVDHTLFRVINTLPDGLARPLWLMQLAGVVGAPAVVSAIALTARRFRLAVALLLLVPAKLVVEHDILKSLVTHSRPGALMPDAVLRDVPTAGLAFPSGHALVLFGIVTLLGPYASRVQRAAALAIAILAATARIYLGAHTPVDVLGGAAAGIALGALLNLIVGVRGHAT